MEEQEKAEPEFVRGFNEGYLMAQHMPELAEKLAKLDSDFIRLVGFKEGREQYKSEQTKTRLPEWLTGDRHTKDNTIVDKTKDRDIDLEK